MKNTYWITYSTGIAEETWHNDVLELNGLTPEIVGRATRFDLRSVRSVKRTDGGHDRYYTSYIDGKRDADKTGPRYLRVSDPWK